MGLYPLVYQTEIKFYAGNSYFNFWGRIKLILHRGNKLQLNKVRTERPWGTSSDRIPCLWNNQLLKRTRVSAFLNWDNTYNSTRFLTLTTVFKGHQKVIKPEILRDSRLSGGQNRVSPTISRLSRRIFVHIFPLVSRSSFPPTVGQQSVDCRWQNRYRWSTDVDRHLADSQSTFDW